MKSGVFRGEAAKLSYQGRHGKRGHHIDPQNIPWPVRCRVVVNIIVLWNTLYMTAAVERLKQHGYPVLDDDLARLSPLIFEHLNMLGRYSFAVPEEDARGELRPLRNPGADL